MRKFCSHRFVLVHVQLATLTHTKHTYMWVKSKNTTSCKQQNASTEYKSGKTTVQGILSDWNCLFHVDIGAVLHKT